MIAGNKKTRAHSRSQQTAAFNFDITSSLHLNIT